MKLILATRNLGKVNELTTMLNTDRRHQNIQILSLQDFPDAPEVIEDGDTYQENAAKKSHGHRRLH
jgi:XTP/dITP diphosphohydrolase